MTTPETALLGKLLDLSVQRQQTLATNIANANTPGYVRQRILFDEALKRAAGDSSAAGLAAVEPDYSHPPRTDGNNVNLGKELGELTQNGVYHQLVSRALSTKMRIYHQAIG